MGGIHAMARGTKGFQFWVVAFVCMGVLWPILWLEIFEKLQLLRNIEGLISIGTVSVRRLGVILAQSYHFEPIPN
jgi:hypothetical protein